MRDVLAGEGVEDERILDSAAAGLLAVDLGEGEDFATCPRALKRRATRPS